MNEKEVREGLQKIEFFNKINKELQDQIVKDILRVISITGINDTRTIQKLSPIHPEIKKSWGLE